MEHEISTATKGYLRESISNWKLTPASYKKMVAGFLITIGLPIKVVAKHGFCFHRRSHQERPQ